MEVIVIGGSAAGLKAACRIRRLQPDANVTVVVREEIFGYSTCGMAYYLSGDIDNYKDLITTPAGTFKDEKYFRDVKGVNILTRHEAVSIDRIARFVRCVDLRTNSPQTLPYDNLVIATGASPLLPGIPGITLPGVEYFHTLKDAINTRQALEQGKISSVAIIGGGFIGIELCEAFRAMWGVDVHLIELRTHVLSGILDPELSRLVESELIEQGVNLRLGCNCREIKRIGDHLVLIDGSGEEITFDKVFVVTGVIPNIRLADDTGLKIGVTGGIFVNDRLQTSDPEIYAVGDCVELTNAVDGKPGFWALGSLANRMGRIAGDNICNGDSRFGSVAGVTIVKFFDLSITSVGLNTATCHENGYDTAFCWGTFHDRLWYFPGSGKMHTKLIYDDKKGQILGFQAVANGDILHLADKAAQIIQAGWTVDKLPDLEQAYSPPYSQPFDPFHTMAFIDDNSRSAGVKLLSPNDFDSIPNETVILDVRKPEEIEAIVVNKGNHRSVNIPLEELRGHLTEIPKKCSVVIICEMGSRSWEAALMLRRAGWSDVSILAGGALFLPKNTIKMVKTEMKG